jgi:hypothetical protein
MQTHPRTLYRAYPNEPPIHQPRLNTWRPPGSVPYVVDNLWEWARPEGYPTRRTAAFASPTSKEAGACHGEFVYCLTLQTGTLVAQLERFVDSKLHPDVKGLPGFIRDALGPDWFSKKLASKGEEASLFCPCLHKDEIESIILESTLIPRPELFAKIGYWSDVRLIALGEEPLATSGEIFFTVPAEGYTLTQGG